MFTNVFKGSSNVECDEITLSFYGGITVSRAGYLTVLQKNLRETDGEKSLCFASALKHATVRWRSEGVMSKGVTSDFQLFCMLKNVLHLIESSAIIKIKLVKRCKQAGYSCLM